MCLIADHVIRNRLTERPVGIGFGNRERRPDCCEPSELIDVLWWHSFEFFS